MCSVLLAYPSRKIRFFPHNSCRTSHYDQSQDPTSQASEPAPSQLESTLELSQPLQAQQASAQNAILHSEHDSASRANAHRLAIKEMTELARVPERERKDSILAHVKSCLSLI